MCGGYGATGGQREAKQSVAPTMILIQKPIRAVFLRLEKLLDTVFPPSWNPLYNLGALGFFMYWIVAATGIYLYIFFDTGITEAYDSIEYMTNDQWYLAGVMRSLHRYASDAMVLFMIIHVVREFSLDRYRGARWFTWFTGVPIFILVYASGITGYWLVWDRMAQYLALMTTEWLDWLPIFGTSIAANFVSPTALDDRFFTLMIFLHIAAPLFLLIILWIHLQRVSKPIVNPPRGLAAGIFASMIVLSLVWPAVSQAPADLSTVVSVVNLDWFYMGLYPLLDYYSAGSIWAAAVVIFGTFAFLPWMPPLKRSPAAKVILEHCNGCTRCMEDCPYNAIMMVRRSDGLAFDREAKVNTDLCVSCGICVGSCPSASPFRKRSDLISGIELPHYMLDELRTNTRKAADGLEGDTRILVFGCDPGARIGRDITSIAAMVRMPCIGMLPPAFIDWALSRGMADGVVITGCREGNCQHRFGVDWINDRLDRKRAPQLRRRVPRERILRFWASSADGKALDKAIIRFAESLSKLPEPEKRQTRKPALEGA